MKKAILLALLMTGCSGAHVKPICPPIVSYDRVDQNKLADELSHGVGQQTERFLADYAALRKSIKACNNG